MFYSIFNGIETVFFNWVFITNTIRARTTGLACGATGHDFVWSPG